MNNLPVVYLYANLILPCIDAIEYITNVFSIKIPQIREGEGRERLQATLALHRHCHGCHRPPHLSWHLMEAQDPALNSRNSRVPPCSDSNQSSWPELESFHKLCRFGIKSNEKPSWQEESCWKWESSEGPSGWRRTAPATCWRASGQPGDTTLGVGRLLPQGEVPKTLAPFLCWELSPGMAAP